MKFLILGVLAFSLFLAACEDPAANKTKATVNETNVNKSSNSVSAPRTVKGDALEINVENSKIGFTGSKVTGKHEGGFKEFTGTIDLVNSKVEDSSVSVDIDTASIYADNEKLTGHLKSADFFDVEKYPRTSFSSTNIVADTTKGPDAYNVTGDFQIHGVTKSITFPATIKVSPDIVTVNTEFSINRKDFGIVYAGNADDLIRDDVVIRLDIRTPRKN